MQKKINTQKTRIRGKVELVIAIESRKIFTADDDFRCFSLIHRFQLKTILMRWLKPSKASPKPKYFYPPEPFMIDSGCLLHKTSPLAWSYARFAVAQSLRLVVLDRKHIKSFHSNKKKIISVWNSWIGEVIPPSLKSLQPSVALYSALFAKAFAFWSQFAKYVKSRSFVSEKLRKKAKRGERREKRK